MSNKQLDVVGVQGQAKRHELSNLFPDMSPDDFESLVEDIKTNGLIIPITTYEDQIIDGWHRYRACIRAGVRPEYRPLDRTANPAEYVRSVNINRRQLTTGQRVTIEVALVNWKSKGRGDAMEGESAEDIAKRTKASVSTVKLAKQAINQGIQDEVISGKKSIYKLQENKERNTKSPLEVQQAKVAELTDKLREQSEQIIILTDKIESYQNTMDLGEQEITNTIFGLRESIRSKDRMIYQLRNELLKKEKRVKYLEENMKNNDTETEDTA